jgi:hypothetical protein
MTQQQIQQLAEEILIDHVGDLELYREDLIAAMVEMYQRATQPKELKLAGESFQMVAEKAKTIALEKGITVEFDFNGITCMVSKETDCELLYRDYGNAFRMEWKTVGPDCTESYSPEVQAELKCRQYL